MLSEKRIKEAKNNVRSYLQEGLLQKKLLKEEVLNILIKNAKESLDADTEALPEPSS